ncbi:hypothetical protein ACWEF9_33245 [Streptomyces sp. NPDC004980]
MDTRTLCDRPREYAARYRPERATVPPHGPPRPPYEQQPSYGPVVVRRSYEAVA